MKDFNERVWEVYRDLAGAEYISGRMPRVHDGRDRYDGEVSARDLFALARRLTESFDNLIKDTEE